jgi:hypothetical protein
MNVAAGRWAVVVRRVKEVERSCHRSASYNSLTSFAGSQLALELECLICNLVDPPSQGEYVLLGNLPVAVSPRMRSFSGRAPGEIRSCR